MTFRLSAETLLDLLDACIDNAVGLHGAAKQCLQDKRWGLACSLSVLSLEEIGKMVLVDGLLLAKQGSERATRFERGKGNHETKLLFLNGFPLYLQTLALLDPDAATQKRRKQLLQQFQAMKEARANLAKQLGRDPDPDCLNRLKQNGFYVGLTGGGIIEVPHAVAPATSRALERFSFSVTGPARSMWNHVREPYRRIVASLRAWTDEERDSVREAAEKIVEELFSIDEPDPSES